MTVREELDQRGYALMRGLVSPERLERLRERVEAVYAEEGERAGHEFRKEEHVRRLANLVAKGREFEDVVLEPAVLQAIGFVLGEFKLSSLNARSANPGEDTSQPLHVDCGMLPDEHGNSLCNTIWLLDDFTLENGATRCVPGTHQSGVNPIHTLADPNAAHPDEVLVLGKAGDVVVMNAHMWHGGTANRTSLPRRALHALYCRKDQPQQQYQKALIPEAVQSGFRPELRRLLALDDPLNDEISSKSTRASGFLK